jgi:hypothetical protein
MEFTSTGISFGFRIPGVWEITLEIKLRDGISHVGWNRALEKLQDFRTDKTLDSTYILPNDNDFESPDEYSTVMEFNWKACGMLEISTWPPEETSSFAPFLSKCGAQRITINEEFANKVFDWYRDRILEKLAHPEAAEADDDESKIAVE